MVIKKKVLFSYIVGLFCCFSLVSCSLFGNSNPDTRRIEPPTSVLNSDGTRSWTSHVDNAKMLSYQGISAMESTGEQKILVVPVSFESDEYNEFSNVPVTEGGTYKETLQKAFFGEASDTGWESVKSYYYKSSYGKLNLTGEVLDEITINHSIDYYNNRIAAGSSSYSVISELTRNIFSLALSKNRDFDFDSYDLNHDEIIDGLWFVYNVPYERHKELSWALTTTNQDSQRNLAYKVGTFSWASYWFLEEGKDSGGYYDNNGNLYPDCHTFIHETGHILGLDDYYSYDSTGAPVGGLDMMDYNIGDHMAFSKYLLNWVSPKEIISEGTYTLNKFSESGDCFIIGNNFNGTAFDEYLILEYYTPTDLNELDATVNYSLGNRMFSRSGLRIYHVDSRLGYVDNNLNWNQVYNDQVNFYVHGDTFSYIINNNTPSFCLGDTSFSLVELVSKRTQGDIVGVSFHRPVANNNDLFYQNESLNTYAFNDGSSLAFSIRVTDINSSNLTLKIEL